MTTSTTQCEEKKILADAKYLGLVEFVQGPIMEGEANDFTKHFRGCSDDRLKRFWVGAGQLAAHPVRAEFFGLTHSLGAIRNLMVDFPEEGLRVIGIDQAVRGISDAGLAKYLGSLRDLLHALWDSEAGWESSSSFRRVHAAIEAWIILESCRTFARDQAENKAMASNLRDMASNQKTNCVCM
ncbi:unnamed protein product [Durusdinium trenchii]|uniref:Uncharacterized protein n=1 Tax=Durusdinium trenchii TaxID=1381693 RepID=A0ABP0LIH5_9DINO